MPYWAEPVRGSAGPSTASGTSGANGTEHERIHGPVCHEGEGGPDCRLWAHIGFSCRFACTLSHGFSALYCARSRYSRFTTAESSFHLPCFVGSPAASAMACAPPDAARER